MKIYRVAMKNEKTGNEIFFAKCKTKAQANATLRAVKKVTTDTDVEVYILEAELLEEKKK